MQHLIDTRPSSYRFEPPHEVRDEQKVADLVASLDTYGWDGPPLLVEGECAVTGSHRIPAVDVLTRGGTSLEVPVLDIAELAADYGIDWQLLRKQHPYLEEAAQQLAELLPSEVVATLGMDLH